MREYAMFGRSTWRLLFKGYCTFGEFGGLDWEGCTEFM